MLTIAQITDLHITSGKDPENRERNERRLRQVLKAIHARQPRPVAIIATGDLTNRGEAEEYAALAAILAEAEIPIHLGVGNHDRRGPLREVFGSAVQGDPDGFVQYAVDFDGLRILVCDTLEEGQEGGGFCERRAAWLARKLDTAPELPTVVALHHPPIPSGIQWMDPAPGADWIARLKGALEGRKQLRGLVCGHVHRPFHAMFAGHLTTVSPATSIQLTLDLTPVDPQVPDGREILVEEPPGYGLLAWDGRTLTTHVCVAGDFAPAVHFTRPF